MPISERLPPLAAPIHHVGSNDQAVVLVHGFTGVPAHFRPLARYLHGHGYTVIAPRLAGHGTSPADMATTSGDDWIRSAEEALEAAMPHHESVHLVGLSMGGLISILIGAGERAATISTINAPITFRDRRILLTPFLHRLRPMVHWPEEAPPDLDPDVADLWRTYRSHPTRAAADLLSISRRAHRVAAAVTSPTLVIQSLVDETVDPRSGRQLAEAFGGDSRLLWLEHSIHNSLLDDERDLIHRAVLERIEDRAPVGPG